MLPVVTRIESENHLEIMKWGLIPHWSKDSNIGYKMINARSETLLEKPSFTHPFKNNRCLIPISGFYEWKKLDEKHKIPFFIHFKDQEIISLAGIFENWTDPITNELVRSFSIITTSANEQMQGIHDRMPIMLDTKDENKYLESEVEEAYSLLKPSKEKLDIYEISSMVNSPRNNYKELLEKVN